MDVRLLLKPEAKNVLILVSRNWKSLADCLGIKQDLILSKLHLGHVPWDCMKALVREFIEKEGTLEKFLRGLRFMSIGLAEDLVEAIGILKDPFRNETSQNEEVCVYNNSKIQTKEKWQFDEKMEIRPETFEQTCARIYNKSPEFTNEEFYDLSKYCGVFWEKLADLLDINKGIIEGRLTRGSTKSEHAVELFNYAMDVKRMSRTKIISTLEKLLPESNVILGILST